MYCSTFVHFARKFGGGQAAKNAILDKLWRLVNEEEGRVVV